MNEQLLKKNRKYKRDHNMKKTEHGLVVMECRLKKEILSGNSCANAYVTVMVPFYDASIRELVSWMRETFPEIQASDLLDLKLDDMDMELFQIAHGRPDKNGNAPMLLTFRIMKRNSFRGLEDVSMEGIQRLFDNACGLQDQTDDKEDTADASPASLVL